VDKRHCAIGARLFPAAAIFPIKTSKSLAKSAKGAKDYIPEMTRVESFSDQIGHDLDVAARRFGIRTSLVRSLDEGPAGLPLHTRQADVETGLQ
jgi:hypothetical protein